MATDYVHLHKKALSSWVFNDPRRWHFFSYLMMKADEKGYAEISVNEYCKTYGQERTFVQRLLKTMEEMGICEPITLQKRTIVFLCKYESYNGLETESAPIMRQKCADNVDSEPSQKDKKEKDFPPDPLYKEKEKKENVPGVVASLQEKKEKTAAPQIFSQLEPIEKRRERFWADVCHSHALHREWPVDGVKSFFLFWTQPSKDGQRMLFEQEAHFGITYRMNSYLQYGHWLTDMHEAKLQLIRSKQSAAELERKRARAAAEEASNAYDRAFEEMERKRGAGGGLPPKKS